MEQINAAAPQPARPQHQIELMRSDNAKLRGQFEQTTRELAELQRAQKDIRQGVEERMRKLEPQKVTLDGREFSVDPEEKRQYDDAMAQMRGATSTRPPRAGSWPSSAATRPAATTSRCATGWATRSTPSATTRRRWPRSGRFVTTAPEHQRAPEALLAMANCQSEMKDPRSARKTLEDLVKAYPTSEAAGAARERLVALK
jgi:TolA-binding protein